MVELSYLITVFPFDTNRTNMIAVFNECTILVCGYHLLLLTDYIEEDYQHYNAGWSLVGVTVLNLVVNLAVVVYDMLG